MKNIEGGAPNPHVAPQDSDSGELIRLVVAAVISEEFRRELLANPEQALASGYNGKPFNLAEEERMTVLSIRTTSLTDFATQLVNGQNGQGAHHKNGYHKNGYHTSVNRFPFSADYS